MFTSSSSERGVYSITSSPHFGATVGSHRAAPSRDRQCLAFTDLATLVKVANDDFILLNLG